MLRSPSVDAPRDRADGRVLYEHGPCRESALAKKAIPNARPK